ncbi:MAG: IS701 family transposase [Alphaproteobacteria bacterium]|nr:IS701 family transposase [Alphaproteobacteria bacterium]
MGKTASKRFGAYVDGLTAALGHADRDAPFRHYTTGLLLPLERKSVEPIAARVDPGRVGAAHQSLHHFVAKATWSDQALLSAVRGAVLPSIERHGQIEAWIVDDTGFPKKGKHSVGVARQYCGQLGKQDNCQVAVSLSVANEAASLPIDYRLYLPKDWAGDPARRAKAGVPDEITFQTKPSIALDQIRKAVADGIPPGVVLADAGYGADMKFQTGLLELGLDYIVGIQPNSSVWTDGKAPKPAKPWSGQGRPPTRLQRSEDHQPVLAKDLALSLPASAWQDVTWRAGTKGDLVSRFTAQRIRPAHRDYEREEPWPELWLLIERPEDEDEPTKFWFANLPADTSIDHLVRQAKLRWRIERDYLELKQELGLGHYEGRGWRGFHHHASLCIAAYGFLVAERLMFPPKGGSTRFRLPVRPKTFKPRGSTHQARTSRRPIHRHNALAHRHRTRPATAPMSMLPTGCRYKDAMQFMTQ